MSLPPAIRAEVEEALGPIRGVSPVGGGSINEAARVELEDSSLVFLKYNAKAPSRMFGVEATGLQRMRDAASLRVPAVLGYCDEDGDGHGWLALEWLEPGRRRKGFGRRLAYGLVSLHRAADAGWGWEEDGFIGSLPQSNLPADTWPTFWWKRRLEPQLDAARANGARPGSDASWERLATRLDELLAPGEEEGPSLLHGDLWSGNVLAIGDGEPAVVDPAAYSGHREVDLAMSELFGGFDREFYAEYSDLWPLQPGYQGIRREIYQLYYLLVHVNLFGGGYVSQATAMLEKLVAAV